MGGTILWRSGVLVLTVLLFAVYSALMLGFEIGVTVGLHIVKNIWLNVAGGLLLFVVPICLYAAMLAVEEDSLDVGFFGGVVVALCGLGVAAQLYQGLDERALHEHGRQVQAVVSHVYWQDGGSDAPTRMVDFTDLSGQPVPGALAGAGGLKVGQRVTVTVDPAGKVPMALGTPTGAGAFHTAKIAGGIEELALIWPAYRGAAVFLRTKKPRKPQDLQEFLEPLVPQAEPVSQIERTATIDETEDEPRRSTSA
ncbi:MAG: hypothetical protein HOW97_22775 [Catenulispora sp.]|nr:hypothetical protein [Catenulispora sp.]